MKYLNVFDNKSALDSSVTSINHGDGAYVFGVETDQGIEDVTIYDQRHPGANCLKLNPVNMSPVKLDSSSTKKTPAVADVLYSTADGKLTLDALTNGKNNTAIAICVIPEVTENFKNGDDSSGAVKTARFVSLNYMNCDTPTTGSDSTQLMYFGNNGTTIGNVKGGTDKTSYIGGKWNTQLCLSKATNQDVICDGVTNKSGAGYSPAACCCVAYSTPGTKSGDWYLPMPGELYQIYANKTVINEKRIAIKGSGFGDYKYWSSREDSSYTEYSVLNGNIYETSKSGNTNVLGFLALELPAEKLNPVNMSPVKLDVSSSKKKPAVADVLYSTADGKLTLDALTNSVDNTPIAICVIPEVIENFKNGDNSAGAVKTARFVSLNYMNCDTPTTGSDSTQWIYFGNYGTTIGNVKGGTDETAYIGGKWNTQLCLSKATNLDLNICGKPITNSGDTGYCAPACCCVAYSTSGTKSGDWYLPMPGELYQIYANKTAINEKRTAIKGSGFSETNYYWSSIEYSSNYEYFVGIDNGSIYRDGKGSYGYVLGFLALEV